MINKISSIEDFKSHLKDGMSIMVGGFMASGTPIQLVDAIIESNIKDLTLYCNDAGYPDKGIGKIIANHQVKTLYTSHIGLNPYAQQLLHENKIEIILVPQGTLAEQIRAGGSGLGGVLTPTGIGTKVADNKSIINVDGKDFILEKAFRADLAIIKSNMADRYGNGVCLGTTRNFNPVMSMACDIVYLESDEIQDHLDHNLTNIYGVCVDGVIEGVK